MEDLDEFFDPSDGITQTAVWTPVGGQARTIYGQFTGRAVTPFGMVEQTSPTFFCALNRVPNVAHGDALTVAGTDYTVVEIDEEGTGLVTLRLNT